jgi:hypothetical protein
MKKRKKVLYPKGSPMEKSLQRFKELWKTNPESMEARRKRGVEKRIQNCDKYFEKLWALFVHQLGEEISPEQLNRICYDMINEKRNRGKWTKLKSIKRYLTKYRLIKYDFERDIYLNWRKIKHQEKERAEAERIKAEEEARRIREEAQRAEDERLRLERLEADRVQREAQQAEAQQRHREPEPQQAEVKPPQAHRETQPQQGTQAEPSELERLKKMREKQLGFHSFFLAEAEKDTNPANAESWKRNNEKRRLLIADLEIKISELENCEAKCS